MRADLSQRERRLLEVLHRTSEERSDQFSALEIAAVLEVSPREVETMRGALESKGFLRVNPDAPSGFELLRPPPDHRGGRQDREVSPGELGPAQRRVLEIYHALIDDAPPTFAEVAARAGLSKTRVYQVVDRLIEKGFLRQDPAKARSVRLTQKGIDVFMAVGDPRPDYVVPVPVLGGVAAGVPNSFGAFHEDWLYVPREIVGRRDPRSVFVLRVSGESMIGSAFLDGDRVVVERFHGEPVEGEMVVAQGLEPPHEVTVKLFRRLRGQPSLVPANPRFGVLDASAMRMIGRVIAVLRFPVGVPGPR
jgi:repressor LexA